MALITTYRDKIDELPEDWKASFRNECKRHKEGLAE